MVVYHYIKRLLLICALLAGNTWANESLFYPVDTIELPEDVQFEVSGLATLPDGRIAAAIRKGEVWIYSPEDHHFHPFATGLHEPLGLAYHDGDLYTCQRSEVTRLRDTNEDGTADEYLTYARGWGVSGNYHEYAYGPVFDPKGNMYITLNCSIGKKVLPRATEWRGWSMMKPPGGILRPVSGGMRSPIGLGLNHLGDIFGTDHQGNWFPTCPLYHIEPGVYHGHADALQSCSLPGATFQHPGKIKTGMTVGEAAKNIAPYRLPAVWFPYKKTAMGTTGIICDTTGGKFGPFTNQLFVGEFTLARINRVFLEKIDGAYQGAVFPFRSNFQCGVLCMTFDKRGSMYVGQSNRGWNSLGNRSFGLQRVWHQRKPFDIQRMEARPDGFTLTFTQPVALDSARDPASYAVTSYTYAFSSAYGGDEIHLQSHTIKPTVLDAHTVHLQVSALRATYVHELQANGIRSKDGFPLLHPTAYYTLNRIPNERPNHQQHHDE